MRTKTNRLISMCMILTMLVSLLATMPVLANTTNSGGVLLYESFTGLSNGATVFPTTQPTGTTTTIGAGVKVMTDTAYGLGQFSALEQTSQKAWSAAIPPSYNGTYTDDATETDEVATQGPNAKLTLEFDFKGSGAESNTFRVALGTKDVSPSSSTGRTAATVVIMFRYPSTITVYTTSSKSTDYTLPEGISFADWHRYQLTLNLTDENSVGQKTFTFKVDGKNLLLNGAEKETHNIIGNGTVIEKMVLMNYNNTASSYLDNVSVYKTVGNNSLSTGELMTKLHEVNAKMAEYRAAAAGAPALNELETAAEAAGNMVTSAFGTYGTEPTGPTTQANVNAVLDTLKNKQAALENYIATLNYPGGLYFYEPFDGTRITQAEGTTLSTSHLEGYNPTSSLEEGQSPQQIIEEVTDLPGSTAAMKNKANWLNTIVNFPAVYNADGHDGTSAVDALTKEGKNAKLVIEYDIKTTGNAENAEDGTELFVMVGAKGMTSGSATRKSTAAAYALDLPDSTQTASYVTAYRGPSSANDPVTSEAFDLTKWQHHKLTVDLTSETAGLARYRLEVDGEVIVSNTTSPGHHSSGNQAYAIEELKMYTVNEHINVHLANLSVYKVTEDHPAFSPAELSVLLREVYGKKNVYETSGAWTAELNALNTAYDDAISALRTSYTTAMANEKEAEEAAQTAINTACANLIAKENALKAVLPPYYVAKHTTDETTGALTGITVEALNDYTATSAKIIVATYNTEGMVAASIQDFTAAGEITLSAPDVTGKLVKVFIWDIGASPMRHLAPVYTFGVAAN